MAVNNRITVNLNAEEHAALSALSERFQVSLAWLGRRAIVDLIEQCRNNQDLLNRPLLSNSEKKE
jgi:hypothetical protein